MPVYPGQGFHHQRGLSLRPPSLRRGDAAGGPGNFRLGGGEPGRSAHR